MTTLCALSNVPVIHAGSDTGVSGDWPQALFPVKFISLVALLPWCCVTGRFGEKSLCDCCALLGCVVNVPDVVELSSYGRPRNSGEGIVIPGIVGHRARQG